MSAPVLCAAKAFGSPSSLTCFSSGSYFTARSFSHQPHVVNPNDNKAEGPDLSESSARCGEAGQAPEAGPAFRQESRREIGPPHARSQDLATAGGHEARRATHSGCPATGSPAGGPASPSAPAAGAGSSGDSATPAAHRSNRCSMNPSRPPLHPASPALTPARRPPEMPFARRNGMLPRIPAGPRATTGRMRPPNIRPWGLARKFSATPWGSILALT